MRSHLINGDARCLYLFTYLIVAIHRGIYTSAVGRVHTLVQQASTNISISWFSHVSHYHLFPPAATFSGYPRPEIFPTIVNTHTVLRPTRPRRGTFFHTRPLPIYSHLWGFGEIWQKEKTVGKKNWRSPARHIRCKKNTQVETEKFHCISFSSSRNSNSFFDFVSSQVPFQYQLNVSVKVLFSHILC